VQAYHATVTAWMVEMETSLPRGKTLMEDLNTHTNLFVQVRVVCLGKTHVKQARQD